MQTKIEMENPPFVDHFRNNHGFTLNFWKVYCWGSPQIVLDGAAKAPKNWISSRQTCRLKSIGRICRGNDLDDTCKVFSN